jgi:hypothetical protein
MRIDPFIPLTGDPSILFRAMSDIAPSVNKAGAKTPFE